mgnify:CR=1 FL=1
MPSLLQMSFAIFFSIVVKNTNIETIDPKMFCLFTQYPSSKRNGVRSGQYH